MQKTNGLTLLLSAAASVAGAACTLPTPEVTGTGITGPLCAASNADGGTDADAGASALVTSTVMVSDDVNHVVTPMACAGTGPNPNAIDKYSQGYTQSSDILSEVQMALAQMSLADKAAQMRGTAYGAGAGSVQYSDIQRSKDTALIRGWRFRDASRGMNLGEDMDGAKPNAGHQNGENVGYSTVFPVSMARGAAFDLDLEYAIGEAIGDEMQAAKQTLLLAPCMNVLRHPAWGRAQETYGEDPYEIGRLASAMIVGAQQHIAANAKHFMGYDIENMRAFNDSAMDEQTLREVYGRHFRMAVQDGGVASVMASYNLVNETKSTQNAHSLTDVLRTDFGFKGFVLSDWWAMPNTSPSVDATTLKMTAVQAVKAGLDVELPWALNYGQLENIVNAQGGLTRADIDASVARILEQKFRFNADKLSGAVGIGTPQTVYQNSQILCNDNHVALSERAALESMVLLQNKNGTLPIPASVHKVAVLGATVPYVTTTGSQNSGSTVNFATDVRTGDLGSSRVFFKPDAGVGPYDGIKATAPAGVTVVAGASPTDPAVADADFFVVIAGLTAQDEGEEYTAAGDRDKGLGLDAKQMDPQYVGIQNKLITDTAALKKPMAVVLEGGAVIDVPWLDSVPALVMAWYPGQVGGRALGKLLWGQVGETTYNFGGKLPFTWGQNGDYETFNSNGTTNFQYYVGYRRFDHNGTTPVFPFGAGLSYTTFQYSNLQLGCSSMTKGAVLPVVVNVTNTGAVAGDEIVMVFVSFPNTNARRPLKELKGFARVSLGPGEAKQVTIPVRLSDLDYFKMDSPTARTGQWVVESGPVKIMVGSSAANLPLTQTIQNVTGYVVGSTQ
jgi:beta-glucosidase